MTPRTLAIIPARYASTRLEGKPLRSLGSRSIIEWVYRRVSEAVTDVVVATDDERIYSAVEGFGGRAVMTSTEHRSGTDRCAEALMKVGGQYDIIINVQGDEPFIRREQIDALIECFTDPDVTIATLAHPFDAEEGMAAVENPNAVKVVRDSHGRALYFSRSVIPYDRDAERDEWLRRHRYLRHVGIYAFRPATLLEVTNLGASELEERERLEQLRWLEGGYRIGVAVTPYASIGIDTPEDLARAEELIATYGDEI